MVRAADDSALAYSLMAMCAACYFATNGFVELESVDFVADVRLAALGQLSATDRERLHDLASG